MSDDDNDEAIEILAKLTLDGHRGRELMPAEYRNTLLDRLAELTEEPR